MGSPVLGCFRGRTLMLIGTQRRTVELVLGKGIPCQANRTMVKRFQQGHYLITENQQYSCRGELSCFSVQKNKMMHLIADSAARTGKDMKQVQHLQPREGDTVVAYWDFARSLGQVAIACAVFVMFPSGNIELVCMMTKKVKILNDEEGDFMALRMLQDVLLHAQGLSLQPAKGMIAI
jgi:hypothetical protein